MFKYENMDSMTGDIKPTGEFSELDRGLEVPELNGIESLADSVSDFTVEHEEIWSEQDALRKELLESVEGREELANLISLKMYGQSIELSDRKRRRQAKKLANDVYPDIVVSTFMIGRVMATSANIVNRGGDFSPSRWKDVPSATLRAFSQRRQIDGKYCGVFTNFPDSPEKETFTEKLDSAKVFLAKKQNRLMMLESKIVTATKSFIDYPGGEERFISELILRSQSDTTEDRAFVNYFLYELTNREEGASSIDYAFKKLHESIENGGVAGSFLEDALTHERGSNILSFISELVEEHVPRRVVDMIEQQFEEWPEDLKESYLDYAQRISEHYRRQVEALAERSTPRERHYTKLANIEALIDRVFYKLHGNYADRESASSDVDELALISLRQTDQDKEGVAAPKHRKISAVVTEQGSPELANEDISVEDIVELTNKGTRFKPADKDYKRQMVEVVRAISEDPYDCGGVTAILRAKPFDLEGHTFKVYRADPRRVKGVNVGRRGRGSRVVFALNDSTVAVMAILQNHESYEQYIAQL